MLYYKVLVDRECDLCCIIKYWLTENVMCAVL